MKTKYVIAIVILGTSIIGLGIWFGLSYKPGSYPNAEKYKIKIDESTLILAIQRFKKENPQFEVPEKIQLLDGRNEQENLWYHVYFYYPQENQILYTWVRKKNKRETVFAFVSVNNGIQLGRWKDINKDFSSEENKEQKRKFEERILNKIR
jgi:hypothetical protein